MHAVLQLHKMPGAGGCLTVKTNSCWRCLLPSLRAALPLTASVPPAFFPVTMSRNRFSASCSNQPHSINAAGARTVHMTLLPAKGIPQRRSRIVEPCILSQHMHMGYTPPKSERHPACRCQAQRLQMMP